jgi:hypothetical protein
LDINRCPLRHTTQQRLNDSLIDADNHNMIAILHTLNARVWYVRC